jgi:EAL domain-containing protein (putative c-di-GMP-specific phosphodiesterase class I)
MNEHMPPSNVNRLLVADANADARRWVADIGRELGFAVLEAATATELHDEFARFAPTVVVLDPHALGMTEIALLSGLGRRPGKAAIIITSNAEEDLLASAEELALSYGLHVSVALRKPLTREALEAALTPQIVFAYRFTEQDLRRAIDRAQLIAYYQPRVSKTPQGWKVTGVEALLRWDHPDYGLVYPQEFIGLAEQYDLIGALTDYVLQSGIELLADWNKLGVRLGLAVNLSAKLLTDLEFPERMSECLASRGVAPEQLTLEIRETAALDDPHYTVELLSRLRVKRIGLALDDFGVGYSSLTQLYKLPFSEIKIDRSIGMELPHTGAIRTIVRAMIDLAHNLGLQISCEGVENAAALEFLHQAGCDHAQGYQVARPMPAEQLAKWLRDAGAFTEGALPLAC